MSNKLTELSAHNAMPREKLYRLFDGKGMYIEVTPQGGRYWRLKYRIEGKERRISLGVYPGVTLDQARNLRDEMRSLLAQGIDPAVKRRLARQFAGEERLRQMAELQDAARNRRFKVTIHTDGNLELWKGRHVLRLTTEEAAHLNALLTQLLNKG